MHAVVAALQKLPMVVLVDGNTASASETVTGDLQVYHRGAVISSRTFAKGVVQEVLPLSGGAELKITVAAHRTPLGRDTNHKDIMPNVVVPVRPAGSAAGRSGSAAGATSAAKDPVLAPRCASSSPGTERPAGRLVVRRVARSPATTS